MSRGAGGCPPLEPCESCSPPQSPALAATWGGRTLFVEAVNVFNRTNVAAADPSISIPAGRVGSATENLFPLLPLAGVLIEF